MVEAVSRAAAERTTFVHHPVEIVERTDSGFRVRAAGDWLDAQHVILACEAHRAARLTSALDGRVAAVLPAPNLPRQWVTRSGDGIVWRETHVSGSFDLDVAPISEGLFLGDYQGLGSIGENFVPFFVQTNDGNFANPTDVFASLSVSAIPAAAAKAKAAAPFGGQTLVRARNATPLAVTPELEQRMRDNVARVIQRRLPGGPVQAPPR